MWWYVIYYLKKEHPTLTTSFTTLVEIDFHSRHQSLGLAESIAEGLANKMYPTTILKVFIKAED